MARLRIPDAQGLAAVRECTDPVGPNQPDLPVAPSLADQQGQPDQRVDRATQRLAVRYTLQILSERAPGSSVEVRIPPFAAVQAIPGPAHRRGTPSAVVEMDPTTWLALATGRVAWAQAKSAGRIRASGERADLTPWLPLVSDSIVELTGCRG